MFFGQKTTLQKFSLCIGSSVELLTDESFNNYLHSNKQEKIIYVIIKNLIRVKVKLYIFIIKN